VAALGETDRELLNLTSAIPAGSGRNIGSIVQAISEREAGRDRFRPKTRPHSREP
jgi:hypothetical protein